MFLYLQVEEIYPIFPLPKSSWRMGSVISLLMFKTSSFQQSFSNKSHTFFDHFLCSSWNYSSIFLWFPKTVLATKRKGLLCSKNRSVHRIHAVQLLFVVLGEFWYISINWSRFAINLILNTSTHNSSNDTSSYLQCSKNF